MMSAKTTDINREVEETVGITVDDLAAIYLLGTINGFGPQKFKELHANQTKPIDVLSQPDRLPIAGKRGDEFRSAIKASGADVRDECAKRAVNQLRQASRLNAKIITYDNPSYPRNVLNSNNAVPVLYVRGSTNILNDERAVACVGSRQIRSPYSDLHKVFAETACDMGFVIVSGFALGADTIGHTIAYSKQGKTICVMPGGLDRPFPPENKQLWTDLLQYSDASFVSEFPFGTRVSSLSLRKRNKLIVAFAKAVLVSQSAVDGGAMNAYRFAREQKKPVATFAAEMGDDTTGNDLIKSESKTGDHVFSEHPSTGAYNQWLQGLFFST